MVRCFFFLFLFLFLFFFFFFRTFPLTALSTPAAMQESFKQAHELADRKVALAVQTYDTVRSAPPSTRSYHPRCVSSTASHLRMLTLI